MSGMFFGAWVPASLILSAKARLRVAALDLADLAGRETAMQELNTLARELRKRPVKTRGRPRKSLDVKAMDRLVMLIEMLATGERAAMEGKLPGHINPRGWKLALAHSLYRSRMAHSVAAARKELQRADEIRLSLVTQAGIPSRLYALASPDNLDRKPAVD